MRTGCRTADCHIGHHDRQKTRRIIRREHVSIYLCGVTVYDDAHIGHARTIIVFDVLRRRLEQGGAQVNMIQNFTDVDDKIIARARAENITAAKLSTTYISRYHKEFDRLNVIKADAYPKATDHINEIIEFIAELVKKGAAYTAESGVYFDVAGFDQYGKLSKRKTDELQSGARVEVDESKRDPLDFALWKFDYGNDGPTWDSPWGPGRPGWHIECSAMSMKYLGFDIDIHGGGRDLIFPHHENELAQSESLGRCGPDGLARIWMHVGMVTIKGEKMSKSLGNIRSVARALEDWGPNVIRLFCLSGHYSKPIDYSDEGMHESLTRWRQIEACSHELRHAATQRSSGAAGTNTAKGGENGASNDSTARMQNAAVAFDDISGAMGAFCAALDDDLNTHMALTVLLQIVHETNTRIKNRTLDAAWASDARVQISRMTDMLGLAPAVPDEEEACRIDEIVSKRARLRADGMYQDADKIRDELADTNVEIVDRSGRTVWIKRERIGMDAK